MALQGLLTLGQSNLRDSTSGPRAAYIALYAVDVLFNLTGVLVAYGQAGDSVTALLFVVDAVVQQRDTWIAVLALGVSVMVASLPEQLWRDSR